MITVSCTCGGFVQEGAFVHAETCGRSPKPEHIDVNADLTITIEDGVARWSPKEMSKDRVVAHLANVLYLHRKRGDALDRALRYVERTTGTP